MSSTHHVSLPPQDSTFLTLLRPPRAFVNAILVHKPAVIEPVYLSNPYCRHVNIQRQPDYPMFGLSRQKQCCWDSGYSCFTLRAKSASSADAERIDKLLRTKDPELIWLS
ncbi:hypothetical protein RF11_11824 [Thelohanellus kitauei]|uniref:Uncharacterized protein n=1 Tax=Thelohanellus kitauei TaxID=669202 RepID=A0A0C2JM82_THEKT|nr:hypothetical protein RF11_11824 [Thelohanellus kitauei]